MSCDIPAEVLRYIELVEANTPRACPEQHALAALIRRVFAEEDIRVDREQLRRYLSLLRYFPYERLFPWEGRRPAQVEEAAVHGGPRRGQGRLYRV